MLKKIAILLSFTLVAHPVWGEECFNFDKMFSPDRTNKEVREDLKYFHRLLNKFFYIKSVKEEEGSIPLQISWDTARELSRFMGTRGV